MGCDIHTWLQIREGDKWTDNIHNSFEENRHYGLFGFLAGVRNYSECEVLCTLKGFPQDFTKEDALENYDLHSRTWYTLKQLLDFDYSKIFWDRRITRQEGPNFWNGLAKANEGEGR